MAKESTTSRIPRMDSTGSRIPLPGSLRFNSQQNNTPPLMRGLSGSSSAAKRPTSIAALTPPLIAASNLKKSSSGERLNNAMNIVSKKTTTAFKKIFGKTSQKPQTPNEQKPMQINSNINMTLTNTDTPRSTLMRSNTFVRSNNDLSLISPPAQHTAMAQSTPSYNKIQAQVLFPLQQNTQPLDATFTPASKSVESCAFGTTFSGTTELCKTMNVVSPLLPILPTKQLKKSSIAHRKPNQTKILNTESKEIDVTQIIQTSKIFISSSGTVTPATDATFSNPGSTENMLMIEDVSVPSGFDLNETLQPEDELEKDKEKSLKPTVHLPPNKSNLKLPLNSTMNTERLLDLSTLHYIASPTSQFLNITTESLEESHQKNSTQLLYMTQASVSASATPDIMPNLGNSQASCAASPFSLKSAQSDLVLPIRTPDDVAINPSVNLLNKAAGNTENFYAQSSACCATSLQDVNNDCNKPRSRFSFGLDLTESTLDCSIELIDVSLSSTVLSQTNATALAGTSTQIIPSASVQHLQVQQQQQQFLKKQNSFDMDESLGILTPDQMKEFLDSTTNNTNNMEFPLGMSNNEACNNSNKQQMALHQMRMDQTPSPEELPLDPVDVKTDFGEIIVSLAQQQQTDFNMAAQRQQLLQQQTEVQNLQTSSISTEPVSLHTDTELSKTDPIMCKSNVSKISSSFITSVTSVTSLDTGYQGDGEMSRPASRGAGDHSPSNGPHARRSAHVSRQPSFNQMQQQPAHLPTVRRQDPMTDSDFFTESDADDLLHRGGDRRAQVIDGQLYNCPTLQAAGSVFITEDPQLEDSCMESSGIFTDVENRCDEDLAQMRRCQDTQAAIQDVDMSPDGEAEDSTETVKSNRDKSSKYTKHDGEATFVQGHNSSSNTIANSCSADRLSAATTLSNRTSYCSVDTNIEGESKSFSSLEEAFENELRVASSSSASCELLGSKRTKSSNTTGIAGNGVSTTKALSCVINNKPNSTRNTEQSVTPPKEVLKQNIKKNSRAFLNSSAGSSSYDSAACLSEKQKSTKTFNENSKCSGGNDNFKSSGSSQQFVVRKIAHAPSKWDAVMNKIENNKTVIRKNYNNVKSKVSTTRVQGMGMGSASGTATGTPTTPTARRTPTSALSNSGGPTSPATSANKSLRTHKTTPPISLPAKKPTDTGSRHGSPQAMQSKRLLQNTTKRGRSYSKESQKSSQSDLSMASGAGSPKILAKTPLRAAKKRDVRNLSISPTDLGPPPKTQQKANGASPRLKSSVIASDSKKRALLNASSTTSSLKTNHSSTSSNKSSSTSPVNTRRKAAVTITATAGVLNKDPNRLSSIEQTQTTHKVEPPTELKEINCNGLQQHSNNNNSISKQISQISTRTNSINSIDLESPTVKQINGITTVHNVVAKISPKLQTTGRKTLFQKQSKSSSIEKSTIVVPTSAAGFLDPNELQRLKLLNRHSCNGRLDYESIERHLQAAEVKQQHQDKSVEALGVLIQYLVHELDAFSCPKFKNESLKSQNVLQKTMQLLDEAKNSCTQLQDQLSDKETYYTQREDKLQSLHRFELAEALSKYNDLQKQAKEEIAGLENQLTKRDLEQQRVMNCYRLEMENKFKTHIEQLTGAQEREKELQERLTTLDAMNFDLATKCSLMEKKNSEDSQAAVERERLLNERITILTNELETLRKRKQTNPINECRQLENSELSHDEIAILRPACRASLDSRAHQRSIGVRSRASLPSEIQGLQSEVESLRSVLEMRQSEISRLSKQNQELLRDADERLAMSTKISMMSAHIEMLKSELEIKTEKEKEYQIQLDQMQKDVSHEKMKRTRLGFDNEALQWQLKQRSEQLHIVEAKLSETLNSSNSLNASVNRHSSQSNYSNSSLMPFQTDNVSPPLSPIIKGVIEKPDSVAYVLEIDDETPEVAASKMVKRASSFRSAERSPIIRRQLSLSANNAILSNSVPNPLSQSMSAASVIHSSESIKHARVRSRSVSIKDETSTNCSNAQISTANDTNKLSAPPPLEKDVLSFSSPYGNNIRPRTSTMKVVETIPDEDQDEPTSYKRRPIINSKARLITCDTSALNTGERLDERMLPSHPSLHDLKLPKQCLQIKESAGEAMVSGANSEDEGGCSASSDDLVSMHSSTSIDNSAANAPLAMIETAANMSLEQVLLMDKINSLSGTPMEMSWSDDVIDPIAPIAALNGSSDA